MVQQRLFELFDIDPLHGRFIRKVNIPSCRVSIGDVAGSLTKEGYRVLRVDGSAYKEHLLVWLWYYGAFPKPGEYIDHIDGVRDNNNINNLRIVSWRVNHHNRVEHRAGHLQGTCFYRGKWMAQYQKDGVNYVLGYHSTAEEAHIQYMECCSNNDPERYINMRGKKSRSNK